jgi:hypothetical protein
MKAKSQWALPTLLLLLAAACGGSGTGANSSGDCVLGGQTPGPGAACCNGMTSVDASQGCRQPVGGACYSDDNVNAIPSGKSCCNAASSATYLGTVGICDGGGSTNCTGNASCRVGNVCFSSGFCGGTCLTVGQGTASAQFPCCPGLTASSAGVCYPPAGHLCNVNEDCLSRVCKPNGAVATCQ